MTTSPPSSTSVPRPGGARPGGPRSGGGRLASLLPVGIVVLGVVEIALLIVIGVNSSLWWSLLIVVLGWLVGVALLVAAGQQSFVRLRSLVRAVRGAGDVQDHLSRPAFTVLAAVLFFFPGIITDVVGLAHPAHHPAVSPPAGPSRGAGGVGHRTAEAPAPFGAGASWVPRDVSSPGRIRTGAAARTGQRLVRWCRRPARSSASRWSRSTCSSSSLRRSSSMSQWVRWGLPGFSSGFSWSRRTAVAPQRHSHTAGTSASTEKGSTIVCPLGQS